MTFVVYLSLGKIKTTIENQFFLIIAIFFLTYSAFLFTLTHKYVKGTSHDIMASRPGNSILTEC